MIWNKIKKIAGFKEGNDITSPNASASASASAAQASNKSTQIASENAPEPVKPAPEVAWLSADTNPWHVSILDVRPITLTMTSTSRDPQCAANAISFGGDDGATFIEQRPDSSRIISSNLTFPVDRLLADGVLFVPRQMEHKWAIFYRNDKLIFVRSWLRKVIAVAHAEQSDGILSIRKIEGVLNAEDEDAEFTERMADYLLRSHALNLPYPAPLPLGMESDVKAAAMWCFSAFGNMAKFATPHRIERLDPTVPLRTHSLLHIAVARADIEKINSNLAAGVPADLLAADGLAPLHWALANDNPAVMELLINNGSSVDVRSAEGATPLMNAVQSNKIAAVSLLLSRGAQVDAQDLRGFTALHRAAELGNLEVAKALLAAGASPTSEAHGHTPRSLAEKRGDAAMIALMRR